MSYTNRVFGYRNKLKKTIGMVSYTKRPLAEVLSAKYWNNMQ